MLRVIHPKATFIYRCDRKDVPAVLAAHWQKWGREAVKDGQSQAADRSQVKAEYVAADGSVEPIPVA